MDILLIAAFWIAASYGGLTLLGTFVFHRFPRKPVTDPPDWGTVEDVRIPAAGGGSLEVWRVVPEIDPIGIVVFAHGWGRNRDRMVARARLFGRLGFTAVIHSARDHGGSSPHRLMNAVRFAEDIEAVLDWVGVPVVLYGHSAGAAGAVVAAARHPEKIRLLFLEGCYAHTHRSLMSLYRWFNPVVGTVFGPGILFWMNVIYRGQVARYSPARLAPTISAPVMMIHGKQDRRFPIAYARELAGCFRQGQVDFYAAQGAGHSDSSLTDGYLPAVERFLRRHGALSDEND
jgi:pimeloyl-ACP methyl ester carboxylesterase